MIGDIRNIIVIQSLFDNDKKTGKELYDDIIRRQIDYSQPIEIKMTHNFYDIANKKSFVDLLDEFAITAELMSGGILFHLEMHGESEKKGLIFADGSFIKWETIVDLFREVNIVTKNNLYITMATCYGRYLFEGVNLHKKSPYSGYISASRKVDEGEILDDFSSLFDTLISSGNLIYSYLELEKKGSNFYYKDSKTTFEENFENYKKNSEFKAQILELANQTVIKNGGEKINDVMSSLIYSAALNQIHQEQIKNFDF